MVEHDAVAAFVEQKPRASQARNERCRYPGQTLPAALAVNMRGPAPAPPIPRELARARMSVPG